MQVINNCTEWLPEVQLIPWEKEALVWFNSPSPKHAQSGCWPGLKSQCCKLPRTGRKWNWGLWQYSGSARDRLWMCNSAYWQAFWPWNGPFQGQLGWLQWYGMVMAESRVLPGAFSESEHGAEHSQPCDTRTFRCSFHCSWQDLVLDILYLLISCSLVTNKIKLVLVFVAKGHFGKHLGLGGTGE